MSDSFTTSELVVGDTVLFGSRTSSYRNGKNLFRSKFVRARVAARTDSVIDVELPDGSHIPVAGNSYNAVPLDQKDHRRILWGPKLPHGNEDAVQRYCQISLDGGDREGVMFWVVLVEDGETMAKIVSTSVAIHDAETETARFFESMPGAELDAEPGWKGTHFGNAAFREDIVHVKLPQVLVVDLPGSAPAAASGEQPVPWKAGDLVACIDYTCEVVDGVMNFIPIECQVIDNFVHESEIGAFLPDPPTPNPHRFSPPSSFGSPFKMRHEEDLAEASTKPDHALVLVYDTGPKTSPACHVLGSSGRTFYQMDDSGSDLSSTAPGPGLWMFENARFWSYQSHEGEWDGGVEGDWRPATPLDLATFGFSFENIGPEMADAMDLDVSEAPSLLERYIGLAVSHWDDPESIPAMA